MNHVEWLNIFGACGCCFALGIEAAGAGQGGKWPYFLAACLIGNLFLI